MPERTARTGARGTRRAKAAHAAEAVRLVDIPNIGPSIADDLHQIGIDHPQQLVGRDPYELYRLSNEQRGVRQDPCLIDCFLAAVRFMEGAPAQPWWYYTAERKRHLGND
jgi:hypothetical protein